MGHKKDKTSGIVVGTGKARPNKVWRWAGLLLILILLGVAGWMTYKHFHKTPVPPKTATEEHKEVLQDVAQSNNKRDFKAEASQLQAYLDTNPPAEFAGQEIIRMSAAYMNAKDYDNAITALQTALDKYPDSKLAALRGLGFAYMNRGDANKNNDDYRKAIDYFKQAVTLELASPETQHVAGSDQTNIRYLEDKLQ